MRFIFSCLTFLLAHVSSGQGTAYAGRDYSTTPLSVSQLSRELTKGLTSDREKVKAIFYWITENISYTVRTPVSRSRKAPFLANDPDDTSLVLRPLDERVALNVLRKGTAVCDGYSRLFKILCEYAGIEARVITGYARTGPNRIGRSLHVNHTWNAVYFDSSWHLLDATWSSGYIDRLGYFVRQYDDHYFLTPPRNFIRDHYPEDLRWSLMESPPLLEEFRNGPFRYSAFNKAKIQVFRPIRGIIVADSGDTVTVELEEVADKKTVRLSVNPFSEALLSSVPWYALPRTSVVQKGTVIHASYKLPPGVHPWLYVSWGEQLILRYQLQDKKK